MHTGIPPNARLSLDVTGIGTAKRYSLTVERRSDDALRTAYSQRLSTLHELSPYLGKMRPELAAWAVETSTSPGDHVYDPFCGSGTLLLEAKSRGRVATGSDLNPYAVLLSRAKLVNARSSLPCTGSDLIEKYIGQIPGYKTQINPDNYSSELRAMFHPETLHSLLAWVKALQDTKEDFALACLMGIAHHQRPGFLSYPASHTVPYLRTRSFPRSEFPEMYEYRDVESRLARKIDRALRRLPDFDQFVGRSSASLGNSGEISGESLFDAIITSPPYMGQLHYGRDNRLRLELLGHANWRELDAEVSPRLNSFLQKSAIWLDDWSRLLKPGGVLSVLVGDKTNTTKRPFADLVSNLVLDSGATYTEIGTTASPIPGRRRVRKNCEGSSVELLLQFRITK